MTLSSKSIAEHNRTVATTPFGSDTVSTLDASSKRGGALPSASLSRKDLGRCQTSPSQGTTKGSPAGIPGRSRRTAPVPNGSRR
ncbi:hypothetical protein RKD18_008022 [Streptomyces phaeoluteigriseus]